LPILVETVVLKKAMPILIVALNFNKGEFMKTDPSCRYCGRANGHTFYQPHPHKVDPSIHGRHCCSANCANLLGKAHPRKRGKVNGIKRKGHTIKSLSMDQWSKSIRSLVVTPS